MSIRWRLLGQPGRDNALLVEVDTGHSIDRLLFDCGEGCVSTLPFHDRIAIDEIFFSHLHMDHVGGFDSFFRANFDRSAKPNHIWGPVRTSEILQHRLQGYLWTHCDELSAAWHIHDIDTREIRTFCFELREAFAQGREQPPRAWNEVIVDRPAYSVSAYLMDHGTPSVAYVVREKSRLHVDTDALKGLGLASGKWIGELKNPAPGQATISAGGRDWPIGELREKLLRETPGESIAYLTDFLLDDGAIDRLAGPLANCSVMVCESQYLHADQALATKNFHMTATRVATLAAKAQVQRLVLMHVSDRYVGEELQAMLADARQVYPGAEFPADWGI